MKTNSFKWMKLDNAGKIFPGQNMKRWSNIFRLSVHLKEKIDPEILKSALENTLKRIPSFKTKMRKGFFWNYLEENEMECPISPDISNHCYRVKFKENNGYLFRVYYHEKCISVDIYHSLCDGYGAAVFISTLTGEYLRLKGCEVSCNQFVLDISENVKKEELEDSYLKYADSKDKYVTPEKRVYHKRGTKMPLHFANYTACTMPLEKIRMSSRKYGVTITEFLAAVLLDIHYKKQLAEGKTDKHVSVQVPVNLRKGFPSRTLKNFVLCLVAQINPKEKVYTFEEILKNISHQLKSQNTSKFLNSLMTRNVNLERRVVKYIPLAIKNFFVGIGFRINAEYSTSVLFSNLGIINLPEDMRKYVDKFVLFTGPGIVNGARCGAVTYGDNMVITFSNCYKEHDIERDFLLRLSELGIPVKVATNRGDVFSDIADIEKDEFEYPDRVHIPSGKGIKLTGRKIPWNQKFERVFHT